jgi:nitroreductase
MPLASLSRQEVEAVIAAAVAAPSVLNTQPWLFSARADVVDVFGDRSRVLRVIDPDERALCISCGTALLNLRLAIACLGREPATELLPKSDDDMHLATVRIGRPRAASPEERLLHSCIPRRRTSRLPFSPEPVPGADLDNLERQAEREGAQLHIVTGGELEEVLEVLHEANRTQRADRRVRHEVHQWFYRPDHPGDGLTTEALGPQPSSSAAAVRDFAMGIPVEYRESAEFERAPALAVLLTRGDSRRDWLRAGQALQRVLLAATARGLASSLLTQAAEVPPLRRFLRSPSVRTGYPHAVVRLGYGPRGPASPRRPVPEVLTFEDSGSPAIGPSQAIRREGPSARWPGLSALPSAGAVRWN